ncbi:MAG: 23S rRNA (uracil(1939)-C(5))-methyltransferase RlmD [Dehalococcoidia bacterium]|nr:23S rRNA (uracil(1939)-C(5))-methyltransferase RlmD [Dehalococcoidia bacterium]
MNGAKKGEKMVSEERLRLTFTDIAPQGDALARHDGEVVFAANGIPGEEAIVLAKRRKRYIVGEAVELLRESPHRIEARCPHFGKCSGCQWQHIDYPFQLALKRQMVVRQLRERGSFPDAPVLATLPAAEPWHYRNHARFSVDPQGQLGFVHKQTRNFVPIDFCHLMHPWINSVLAALQGKCAGAHQVAVRYGVNTGEQLIQPKLQQIDIPSGQPCYEEELLGRRFRISAPSFFQVNTPQAENLFNVLRDHLQPRGTELVIDVFAGVGTFATLLAPLVGRVIAVEEAAAAVKDAAVNITGLDNIEFLQGRAEEVLPRIEGVPDVAVLDPPRVGCHRRALAALLQLSPRRIIYVSCEPATLARDLKILCEGGYRLVAVQPVDMFPQTYHVECVATLVRGDISPDLVLASASPRRRELLFVLGLDFEAIAPPEDEPLPTDAENVERVAEQLALEKAEAVAKVAGHKTVVAADTVVIHRGTIMGKPRDDDEAQQMLRRLRGEEHIVITGVAVLSEGRSYIGHAATTVTMRHYSDEEVSAYIASGEALDKAGAYGIQDPLFAPAAEVDGCYLNVVGLPLCKLARMLREAGVSVGPRPLWALPPQCHECEGREGLLGD